VNAFHKPKTLTEAFEIKNRIPEAVWLAGGTELNLRGRPMPKEVISLREFISAEIAEGTDKLEIGAMATVQSLLTHKWVHPALTVLSQAAGQIKNRNIRNIATIGGNIAYRQPSSDLLPVLLVLSASLKLSDGVEEKTLLLKEWLDNPTTDLILAIIIPLPTAAQKFAVKSMTRTACDIALVNVACCVEVAGSQVSSIKIALGSVAASTVLLENIQEKTGANLDRDILTEKLLAFYKEVLSPQTDIRAASWYRLQVAVVLSIDAILDATEGLVK
jgi:probable selenate reductase FAD-binding subunit